MLNLFIGSYFIYCFFYHFCNFFFFFFLKFWFSGEILNFVFYLFEHNEQNYFKVIDNFNAWSPMDMS